MEAIHVHDLYWLLTNNNGSFPRNLHSGTLCPYLDYSNRGTQHEDGLQPTFLYCGNYSRYCSHGNKPENVIEGSNILVHF